MTGPNDFVHLHLHSHYSMLDGHATVPEIVNAAKDLGQSAVGITDHGNMHNVYELQKYAKEAEIQPIFGIEAYMAPTTTNRFGRERTFYGQTNDDGRPEGSDDVSGGGVYTHLTMLAGSTEGLHNLFRFNTRTFTEGYYRKNRGDLELLSEFSKGLIATTGCPSGEVQTRIRLGQYEKAREYAAQMQDILGKENYFLELMNHGMSHDLETRVVPDLLRLAKELGIPLLATNDAHYAKKENADSHEHMLAMQTKAYMSEKPFSQGGKRFAFDGRGYYLKSRAEMLQIFPEDTFPGAVDNTLLIAEMAQGTELKYDPDLRPEIELPGDHTPESYLREQVYAGSRARYGELTDELVERVEMELNVIINKNYANYFLVTQDFVMWAKNQGMLVGPGRGSAGGSVVAYALRITEMDPIRFDLLFERFLNPERDSPPDIDLDFSDRDREKVIQYVIDKYGEECVSYIATFTKMGVKTAIKDSAQILEKPYSMGDMLTKKVPAAVNGHEMTFRDIYDSDRDRYDEAEEFRELVNTSGAQDVIDVARSVEGRVKTTGVHAAGVIISAKPIADYIPLMSREKDGLVITQFDYPTCEALGLLKVDFLGLRNLTIVQDTITNIKKTTGKELDFLDIILGDMDDEKTYELMQSGHTLGVFQLDSGGMQSLLRRLKPTNIEDISAVLALYRPGPMGMESHTKFADAKNGRTEVESIHPELDEPLKDILGVTYGLSVYQEQIQRIAQVVADYSLAQADNLRRAMGKKKKEVLDAEFVPFSEGMKKNGYSEAAITSLWNVLVPFAEYGFNKAHSMGYALMSYITGYFKANYPAEYMSALLTSVFDDKDKLGVYLAECRRMGLEVLPPSVNDAEVMASPSNSNTVVFGMSGLRGVSDARSELIVSERVKNGKFTDLHNFMSRVPSEVLSKTVLEGLTYGGGFDEFGHTRRGILLILPDIAKDSRALKRNEEKGQDSLFSFMDEEDASTIETLKVPDIAEFEKTDLLAHERDVLGLYLTDHPLSHMHGALAAHSDYTLLDVTSGVVAPSQGFGDDAERIRVAGVISAVKLTKTRRGDDMAIITLQDLTGSVDVLVFQRTLNSCASVIKQDNIVMVRGVARVREEGDTPSIMADSVELVDVDEHGNTIYHIRLTDPEQTSVEAKVALGRTLKEFSGKSPVYVHLRDKQGKIETLHLDEKFNVEPSQELNQSIVTLFGTSCLGKWS